EPCTQCRPFHLFYVIAPYFLTNPLNVCGGFYPKSYYPGVFADSSPNGFPNYEVVHPIKVDSSGHFLSNHVSHRVSRIQRRETSKNKESLAKVFYHLQYGGQDLHFNLTLNPHLLASGFLTERRYGGLQGSTLNSHGHSLCYFLGDVWSSTLKWGQAALSTCNGLTGLFKLSEEEFFISPLESAQEKSAPQAHAVYKRHAVQSEHQLLQPLQRERWERRQHRRRIRQRSISTEKWVETLVVADPKMVEYHGSKGVVSYVLSVMNIVAGLFRDASIGNAINIAVVRLILLEKDEEDLKITHHADNSLNSFCKWQKGINMKDDDHPVHHDVAVLITRKDICAAINKPCETLGLSHVAGMCQPLRSCSINEDTGLTLAFTIAHELGHNFGIQHDGNGNDCEPIGKRPFIMSPQLLYGTSPPNWSRCSREYITRFLDRGWGWCLDDPPVRNDLEMHSAPPGVLYSAAHQCKLQYGSSSLLCDDVDNICSTLWCTVASTCHSRLDGAVDGTKCGEGKWCFDGECVEMGFRPKSVNGGWDSWSEWSRCTRTCGVGVQNAQRECVNPVPKYGGKYCLGERRRYRTCYRDPCPADEPSFRHIQCSRFNTIPYKGKFYKWIHVNNRVNPCELHCRPVNEHFSERMLDTVIDGTQCYEGSQNRDICINGICKVGCDYEIDSDAVEDQCGVCHGNGSTCETVRKTFEDSEGLGYVDIGLIPEGARDIRIEEVAEAGNYLALRSNDPEKYFLNGGWTIQWNGEYKAAGTVFTYERTGQLENLSSPGPTMEPVWIQLLFQETNPGVRYEYTISRDILVDSNNGTAVSYFQWIYGAWTECSTTCGTGVQRQVVHCVERTSGIVEEHYCDPSTRPDDKQTNCNKGACPAMWWVGEWQKCSSSCGDSGLSKRTVLCIRSLGLDEQRALQPAECQHLPKPESIVRCNTHVSCPADWTTGSWSECSVSCAAGFQIRDVTCSWNTGMDCNPKAKPNSTMPCYLQDCPINLDTFGNDWSGSGASSKEVFNEIKVIPHFSTTKNQPRGNADLNDIIEDDFSHYSDVEKPSDNSIVKNLQVDDFYYDYNFIRFHEDLSYDFDKDENYMLDNSGIKHGDITLKGTDVPITTSSPSTTADQHSTTMHSDSITIKGTEGHEPQKKDVLDENNDELFAEDYFLPVITTTEPSSAVTRLFSKWKENDSHLSITKKPPSTADVSTQNKQTLSYETETNIFLTPEPHTNSNSKNHDNYRGNQKDKTVTAITEDDNEEDFGEDVPGGESEPHHGTQNYEPLENVYKFETHENRHVHIPNTPLQWRTASPTVSVSATSQPLELLSSAFSVDFAKYKVLTEPSFNTKESEFTCSTSCGLGAIWRSVSCSTGEESDCDLATRPVPARRCYLRPCSAWKIEEWSKCSKNCGVGVKVREIQCYDTRDKRLLRPFHCQATSPRPPVQIPCNIHNCLEWYTSSWGQCSELCGGGEQQRLVTCPETGNCDDDLQPGNIQTCNVHPCHQWITGSWGQCSVSCGGGVQRRLVKCVNTKAELEDENEHVDCDHEPRPKNTKKCNIHDCDSAPPGKWSFVSVVQVFFASFSPTQLSFSCPAPHCLNSICICAHLCAHGHGGLKTRCVQAHCWPVAILRQLK
uniref:ADAM metallopeptidase with thrombospondin type 1 motif 7 n=1 Tax=Cyprinus carpio TaxID=7962 RepID=A0A8C2EN12_CYPCA